MTLYLCAAGDIHGALSRMYNDVLDFEKHLGVTFDWVLQVGDFGVWPDPLRIDRASRKHDGAGEFSQWLKAGRAVPRRTVLIKGNHEDFVWLDAQQSPELLTGLQYLPNGNKAELGTDRGESVCVAGIGGCYGPSDYGRRSRDLQGYARRHYTHDEVERAAGEGADIVLTHDAPAGVCFPRYVSHAAGLDWALARSRPRVCFFGHHHARVDAVVSGVQCIGLNKVACPGHLVAVALETPGRQWSLLGEWSG